MSQVRQVKEATDIVVIIGERLSLQRAGTYHKGLCPFHGEKSPSFFVSDQMQRYKCFGCGATGDALEFLQRYEGLSFYEALKELADRAGITLKSYQQSPLDKEREQILQVLSLAAEYYHYLLTKHKAGAPARAYLQERGVSGDSIRLFQMGYALDAWDGLIKYLHGKKQYSLDLLQKAGLARSGRGGRSYDWFRDRIMFPLTNHRGQVVGFSGRLLQPEAKEAKYINSPETEVYHKSKLLFGYSQLYQSIRKAEAVVVVEGEFDVVSSMQAHVPHVVAIKGSALTSDHAKLLDRSVSKVLLALDTDAAGVAATKKAIAALRATDLELRVISIPSGKDPDDLARSDPAGWRQAVKESSSAYMFLIETALRAHDPATPEGKREILKELGPILAGITHAVELEHYLKHLSSALNLATQVVRSDIQRYKRQAELGLADQGDGRGGGRGNRGESDEGSAGAGTSNSDDPRSTDENTLSNQDSTEQYALFLLFQQPTFEQMRQAAGELLAAAQKVANISAGGAVAAATAGGAATDATAAAATADQLLHTVGASQVLEQLVAAQNSSSLDEFVRQLPEDLQAALFEWHSNQQYLSLADQLDLPREWARALLGVRTQRVRARKARIGARLATFDRKAELNDQETTEQTALLSELAQLNMLEKTKKL